jgi:hypothetical protein
MIQRESPRAVRRRGQRPHLEPLERWWTVYDQSNPTPLSQPTLRWFGIRVSVKATTWVWDHSQSAGNARLVLLAIADAADQEGGNAWPSQQTIAHMTRLSVRTVRRLVTELVVLGELEVTEHGGGTAHTRIDRRPHLYRLVMTGGQDDRPRGKPRADTDAPTGGHDTSNGRTLVSHKRPFSEHPKTNYPSGGTSAVAASPSLDSPIPEEDPMTPPAADTLTLFDVPATAQKQGRERPLSAQTVAAAYVEAFRAHRSGGEPLKRDTGRVARDAAALLRSGEAGPEELAAAAREMGKTQYSNLAMALKIHRERKPGSNQGFAPASPYTNPYWQDIGRDKQERWVHKILTDDATLEFVLRDPAEVQRLCAQHPELATRFGRVA